MYTLNCRGKLLSINTAVVMGIINLTPDSFFTGSRHMSEDDVLSRAEQMLGQGASILDFGGQSTRPGSTRIGADEEMKRVIAPIEKCSRKFPEAIISIDTYHAAVAREAVMAGASIVNDISGGKLDPAMLDTVASLQTPFVCTHMLGSPETMQDAPVYKNLLADLLDFFIQQIHVCKEKGIRDIIVDPGFGFGKTISQNFRLLKGLSAFRVLDLPLMVGLSRKSTIYKTLGIEAEDALNGTTVLHTLALVNGARILRAHDVRAAWEAIQLVKAYQEA